MKKLFAAAGAVLALLTTAPAHAEGTKIFKAWMAVCDNVATCAAYGFQGGETDVGYLMIGRKAGPDEPVRISLVVMPGDDGVPVGKIYWTPLLDGQPLPGFGRIEAKADDNGYWRSEIAGAEAKAFIAAVRNGDELTVLDGGGTVEGRFSLAGITATMLWFDETQGRIGTPSGLIRKGYGDNPAAPAAPVVTRGPETPQTGLPKVLPRTLTALPQIKACDVDYAAASDLTVARLSPGTLLWAVPCTRGAYNTIYAMLLTDETGGQPRHAVFPDAPGAGQDQSGELMNISYDPKTRVLSNFDKARGIGDCGATSDWVWTGKAFVLVAQSLMPDCRGVGVNDWPSVWQAQVR